jgi:hypothetical protein
VEILSFDRDTGHHVTHFDSNFVLSPIMRSTDVARTVFMHLGPGGVVGEHETTVRQVFCVVAGEGWVSGDDRHRVPIKAFQAAHWEEGELHGAGTDSGLVAAVIEGSFTVEAARRSVH